MRAFSKSRRIFWNALMDFIKEERSEMRKREHQWKRKVESGRKRKGGGASSDRSISGPVFGDGDCIWRFLCDAGTVAFLIALLTAFLQNGKLTFADKMKVISAGIGDENIITMSLILYVQADFPVQ